MRTPGKITHWNAEKGYGFITPASGAKQVFVHISAFSNRQQTPQINELVTFTLSTDRQGRPRAVEVARAGESPQRSVPKRTNRRAGRYRNGSSVGRAAVVLIALALAATYVYERHRFSFRGLFAPFSSPSEVSPPKFKCDNRKYCAQMTSCEEAFFFVDHCSGAQMDGDGDGVPCERQWCG